MVEHNKQRLPSYTQQRPLPAHRDVGFKQAEHTMNNCGWAGLHHYFSSHSFRAGLVISVSAASTLFTIFLGTLRQNRCRLPLSKLSTRVAAYRTNVHDTISSITSSGSATGYGVAVATDVGRAYPYLLLIPTQRRYAERSADASWRAVGRHAAGLLETPAPQGCSLVPDIGRPRLAGMTRARRTAL